MKQNEPFLFVGVKLTASFMLIAAVILLALTAGISSYIRGKNMEEIQFTPSYLPNVRQPLSFSQGDPYGQLSVDYLKQFNDHIGGRLPFSYDEMNAAAWIVEELLAMGYTWDHITVQEYELADGKNVLMPELELIATLMDLIFLYDRSPFVTWGARPSRLSQNIILTVPGQNNDVMVMGAHYDSPSFASVSDNASGTALLLESARRMAGKDNPYTIEYVFFGAEEVGLIGSYYYANELTPEQHDQILFMVNADVLIEGTDLFYMAGYDDNGKPGANHITETWDRIAQEISAEHHVNLLPWPRGVYGPSDQLAFLPKGHTAMFLAGMTAAEGYSTVSDEDFQTVFYSMMEDAHSKRDDFHFKTANWPGKMETNMRAYSAFLDALLLADYEGGTR